MAGRRTAPYLLKVLRLQPQPVAIRDLAEHGLYMGRCFTSRLLHSEEKVVIDDHKDAEHEHTRMHSEGGGSKLSYAEKVEELKAQGHLKKSAEDSGIGSTDYQETLTDLKEVSVEAGKASGRDVGRLADRMGLNEQNISDLKEVGVEAGRAAKRDTRTLGGKVGLDPRKVSETATDLKEVGIEAAKAVPRDLKKVAGKIGLDPQNVSETATELKEVAVEAARAVPRDIRRAAEKVGLKSDKQ